MSLQNALDARLTTEDCTTWSPEIFSPDDREDRLKLEQLLKQPNLKVIDKIDEQLLDLVKTRMPAKAFNADSAQEAIRQELAGKLRAEYGHWIHFPWSQRLVHVLRSTSWHALRTNRNRYKITADEQKTLRGKSVGIVGLSVGQAAAVTMALEGVGGEFRLADFDRLELSNMNRLRASVHEIGINKAVLAARQMYEIDPFLAIQVYDRGITDSNIIEFLTHPTKLDLLVEECDDLFVKIRIREIARDLRIPVIMETSDRGMLDIERFDLDPEREVFHGLLQGVTAEDVRNLGAKDKIPMFLAVGGVDDISTRMAASLCEVDESLVSWPQLASAVCLGGSVVTSTSRRLLLGRFRDSGRFYVDVTRLVRHGTATQLGKADAFEVQVSPEAKRARVAPKAPRSAGSGVPTQDEIRYLIGFARYAPSAGNSQPWRFKWLTDVLYCELHESRGVSFVNCGFRDSYVSLGAALENIALAAPTIGLEAQIGDWDAGARTTTVRFTRRDIHVPALFDRILTRHTNRCVGNRVSLAPHEKELLLKAVGTSRLQFLETPAQLSKLGSLAGACDQIRILSQTMHQELIDEICWSPEETEKRRYGLDLATLQLTATDKAVLKIIRRPDAMSVLNKLDLGKALRETSYENWSAASAALLVSRVGRGPDAAIRGGRDLQRMWLAADQLELALHPYGFPGLFMRLGPNRGLDRKQQDIVSKIWSEYANLFEVSPNETEILLARVTRATRPKVFSLRLDIPDLLETES